MNGPDVSKPEKTEYCLSKYTKNDAIQSKHLCPIFIFHEVHSFNPLNTLHIPYYRCNVIDKYNMASC